ncbi:MAG: MiaB/RimO family radical SAM methylthiotransferase, partial [Gemmatimonadota bacterium]
CQMNISDGELMQGVLASDGYEIVDRPEDADVVLVNTCAIREHAERRVLGRVSQLNGIKLERPDLVIGVTGCMAQRMGESLLEDAPYVDLVMGPDGYRTLPEQLRELVPAADSADAPSGSPGATAPRPSRTSRAGSPARQLAVLGMNREENYEGLEMRRTSDVAAWIPIQRGCDHRCTFCIVPYVRGPEKNRRAEDVLDEVRALGAAGTTEVTLLGQTVNSYSAGEWSFPRLLREVSRLPGIRRVRFTSPHPNDVTPELIAVMAEEPNVCEQLHLPAQSGSNRTLKRMLRRYTVESFLEKVERVREGVPDIALSTDIITGFPGETEEEFEQTLELMRRVRFDDAFTYKYSLREGTPATRFPEGDFIDGEVAQRRLEELIRVSRDIQREINRTEVGRVEEVLVERSAREPGQVMGRTRRNKVIAFAGDASLIGSYHRVELVATTGPTFSGRPAGAADEAPGLQRTA